MLLLGLKFISKLKMIFDAEQKCCRVYGGLGVVEVLCRVLKKKLDKFTAAFTRKVRKTMIFGIFGHFLPKNRLFRPNQNFFGKIRLCYVS